MQKITKNQNTHKLINTNKYPNPHKIKTYLFTTTFISHSFSIPFHLFNIILNIYNHLSIQSSNHTYYILNIILNIKKNLKIN